MGHSRFFSSSTKFPNYSEEREGTKCRAQFGTIEVPFAEPNYDKISLGGGLREWTRDSEVGRTCSRLYDRVRAILQFF